MKRVILTICTIMTIFSIANNVYADSNTEKEVITKEYTIKDFDKEKFYNDLNSEIEENGKSYILKGVIETENQGITEKNVEIEKSIIIKNPNISNIISQIDKEIDYIEDGYKGKVILNENSIRVNKNNVSKREYKVYYEQTYSNLPNNDLINIPKTLNIKGTTYYLINPIWNIAETTVINGKEIPSKYNAVMRYEGIKTENVVVDYIANYKYQGTLQKEERESITYKVQYIENEQEEVKENNVIPIIATGSTGSFIFVCFVIFKMNNIKIYNYRDGKFKLIKRVYIKSTDDVIDLVNDKSITNKYKIILSNYLYKKLNSKYIHFKYYDRTFKYKIKSKEFDITV
ncbi:MAG: hypothetical protein HFJ34_06150 [Clostridia bacterium]|nr:hypothetical protein [Clostridia bacterium]